MDRAKVYSKLGSLRNTQLSIISQLVKPIAINAALLNSQLVQYWPHQCFTPFYVGFAIAKPIVEKDKAFTICPGQKCCSYANFTQNLVEGALCIKEQNIYGSVSPGREFWPKCVTFLKKVEPSCD